MRSRRSSAGRAARAAVALAAALAAVPASAAAAGPGIDVLSTDTRQLDDGGAVARASATRTITPCTWSYFGDPRAVARRNWVFTGCIGTDGKVKLDEYNLASGRQRLLTLFRGLEVDDHNNPSLIFFRRKLYAFAAPHSGYIYPRDRASTMRYRVSKRDWGAGRAWGGTQTVPLERGCGLGYTYPNPVVSGRRLFLFMRGPCWYPYFTSTRDGEHWAPPRTLVLGPPSTGRNVRPYAKYDAAPDGSILMTFSDGHPGSYRNSLYYMRYKGGRFYKADGSLIGSTRDLPFRLGQLDLVQPYSETKGRPWPMDIAWGSDGAPAIVYSSRVGYDDTFRYARFNGRRWVTRLIDGQHEIELRYTADEGRTWQQYQLTRNSSVLNFRPVFPRGITDDDRLVVVYVSGSASSFRSYRTVVNMRIDKAPDPTPTPTPTPTATPAP